MPRGFTGPLAERLNQLAEIKISEAKDGDFIEPGKVLICPGGYHMTLKKKRHEYYVKLKEAAQEDNYVPSVDVMMSSAAEHYGTKAMGVVLTGMGSDGKKGMLEIKSKGGYTIAESEETAVVFGMPAEVISAGAAEKVLPLSEIPVALINIVNRGQIDGKRNKYREEG